MALIAAPVAPAAAASGPAPGQRVDLRVLLLAATAGDAGAWQAALRREGVPFDTIATNTAGPITDATLADYGSDHAKYQGVIAVNPDGLGLDAGEKAALTRLEQTFAVRQISDNTYPNADHGLNAPTQSGEQGGTVATLTPDGRTVFPYLEGDVPIDTGSWGYRATPLSTVSFRTLLSAPDGASLLGIYTHSDGVEEMVFTVASNQYQSQNQLLRHGMVNWVTRGVFLGLQRNYLELQVDDVFLPDDIWDSATHTTDYSEAAAVRMDAADAAYAADWSRSRGIRIDNVFNGGGSDTYTAAHGSDPLLAAFLAQKSTFGWINHTYQHPNLDCTTRAYTAAQISDNVAWAGAQGLSIDPTELVTGEHSGLANTRPGNPGTIDPPDVDDVTPVAGGALTPGAYEYGVTGTTPAGETVASGAQVTTTAADASVSVSWEAICGATSYRIYRHTVGQSDWTLVGAQAQPAVAFDDSGAVVMTLVDTGAGGTAAAPPAVNTAVRAPYPQNPNLIGALQDTNIKVLAGDASKPYPVDPSNVAGALYPAGDIFADGPATVVPRHPTNVYYNTATKEQQLDEYNWLYTLPSGGGACVDIPGVTTCNAAPVTWEQYVDSETSIMLGHVQGNDPRPHYFHQTNLAETSSSEGGVFYKVIDSLLARYRGLYRDNAPLVQLTSTQIADELTRQRAWQQDVAAGTVSGYLLDGRVHLSATSTAVVPVTGTTAGSSYAGQRSGWTAVAPGAEVILPVDGAPGGGGGAGGGGGSGGGAATPGAPATSHEAPSTASPDEGAAPPPPAGTAPLTIGAVRVGHHGVIRRRGVVRWWLSDAATVRVIFHRVTAGRRVHGRCRATTKRTRHHPRCRRYVRVGHAVSRPAPAGRGSLRFTRRGGGRTLRFARRISRHALRPGAYRVTVTAVDADGRRAESRTTSFVVKGA